MDDEVAPILLILAAPHELRIEVCVSSVTNLLRVLLLLFQHRLKLRRRNVSPLCLVMRESLDRFCGCGFFGHGYFFPVAG